MGTTLALAGPGAWRGLRCTDIENVLFGKGKLERYSGCVIKQMCATERCVADIDNSFNITCMILLLHFDILSVEVGISAILPFSCFLVHHAKEPRLMR